MPTFLNKSSKYNSKCNKWIIISAHNDDFLSKIMTIQQSNKKSYISYSNFRYCTTSIRPRHLSGFPFFNYYGKSNAKMCLSWPLACQKVALALIYLMAYGSPSRHRRKNHSVKLYHFDRLFLNLSLWPPQTE